MKLMCQAQHPQCRVVCGPGDSFIDKYWKNLPWFQGMDLLKSWAKPTMGYDMDYTTNNMS